MAAIEEWGSLSDQGLDVWIATQRRDPKDFKIIADSLMANPPRNSDDHIFFLSMMLATAIIRLAAISDE